MSLSILGILGAGGMGRGIAEAAALAGLPTVLVKCTRSGSVDDTRALLAASLERAVKKGRLDADRRDAALARLTVTADLDGVGRADLVIESVIEHLPTKQRLLAEVEREVRDSAVLGTNTSSLPVSEVGARLRHPARLLGIHFFSPVGSMKLVELSPTPDTAPYAVERAQDLVHALGKTAVMVGDRSGYIVNRLLVPYLLDAMRALEEGLAQVEAIDVAMRLGCGHPMGPLALADAIGLDVVYAMALSLHHHHHDRRYSPPPLLRRLVQARQLGKKSQLGFYDHTTTPPRANPGLRLLPVGDELRGDPL